MKKKLNRERVVHTQLIGRNGVQSSTSSPLVNGSKFLTQTFRFGFKVVGVLANCLKGLDGSG